MEDLTGDAEESEEEAQEAGETGAEEEHISRIDGADLVTIEVHIVIVVITRHDRLV